MNITEKLKRFRRGPAVILPKDIGLIITLTGLNRDSKVLDAGTGTGFLAAYLANICKELITYENRKEFYDMLKIHFSKVDIFGIFLNKDKRMKELFFTKMVEKYPAPQEIKKRLIEKLVDERPWRW